MKRKIKSEILIVTFVFIASLAVSCNSSDGKSDDVIHPTPTGATQPHTLSPNTTEVPTQETESTFRTNCQKIVSEQLKQQAGEEGTIIFEGDCEGKNGLFKLSNEYQKITPFLSDVSHGVSFLGKFHIPFYVSEDHQCLSYQ